MLSRFNPKAFSLACLNTLVYALVLAFIVLELNYPAGLSHSMFYLGAGAAIYREYDFRLLLL